MELDRREYNNDHTETRRHQSYERLEQLDEFKVPKQIDIDKNDPQTLLENEERREVYYVLYDKILRQCGFLTNKQFMAFQYRVFCDMPFKDVAYSLRFECQMNENEQSAKKHYYAAIRRLKEYFADDYAKLLKKLKDF